MPYVEMFLGKTEDNQLNFTAYQHVHIITYEPEIISVFTCLQGIGNIHGIRITLQYAFQVCIVISIQNFPCSGWEFMSFVPSTPSPSFDFSPLFISK